MRTRLLPLVGVLVFVSAAIHLALGITGLAEAMSGDGTALLSALYLLGGLAALALLCVVALTPATTTAYAAGAGLMVLFLFVYADVHAFGLAESTLGVEFHDHGGSGLPDGHEHGDEGAHGHGHDGGNGHEHTGEGHADDHDHGGGHSHDHGGEDHAHDGEEHDHDDGSTASVLAEHLRGDAYALVSKTAEAAAAVLFAALFVLDR